MKKIKDKVIDKSNEIKNKIINKWNELEKSKKIILSTILILSLIAPTEMAELYLFFLQLGIAIVFIPWFLSFLWSVLTAPKSDGRFKTGYKDNTQPSSVYWNHSKWGWNLMIIGFLGILLCTIPITIMTWLQ